ncbi:MAG: tRNA-uridine aminocarboxypropyltransferase [Bacteriovoracaceae bacterium]
MSQRRASNINRCPECRVNQNFCVCKMILPLTIEGRVSLIVHVRELKLTSNTAQFIQKMIPHQSQIYIRGKVFDTFEPSEILNTAGRPLFLYPHEDAIELNEDFKTKYPGPYHLIIPDGNWHQARRVRRREEGLKDIPAVKLPPGIHGEYMLRRAPCPEWVSTYEAVAHALGILESTDVKDKLLNFFRHWVKMTMYGRTQNKSFLVD